MLERNGIVWASGKSPTMFLHFEEYEDQTCYNVNGRRIWYGSLSYFVFEQFEIVDFSKVTINSKIVKYFTFKDKEQKRKLEKFLSSVS